jgi:hypothetical protein
MKIVDYLNGLIFASIITLGLIIILTVFFLVVTPILIYIVVKETLRHLITK